MKNTIFACLVAIAASSFLSVVSAQQTQSTSQVQSKLTDQTRIASAPKTTKVATVVINTRRPEWNTLHMHDQKESETTIDRLQKIGCEVVKQKHGDHFDIRYRCLEWKSFSVNASDLATWNGWLSQRGMESVAINPPANAKLATVKYRLPTTKTAHIHDAKQLKTMSGMFGMLGCQVQTKDHNGHVDFIVSCPEWITLGVPTDQTAHVWQDWLKSNGFETQHSHTHH